MPTHIHAGAVWQPTGLARDQTITIADGQIAAVEPTPARPRGGRDTLDATDAIVIPGLIDLQVNGALGWSFQAHHRAHFDAIVAYHRSRGTTTLLPTLVTAPATTLTLGLATLADYLPHAPGVILPGIHLEGPFLNPARSGAHDPAGLQLPDLALMQHLAAAAQEQIAIVTLAPELPGAHGVIEWLAQTGVLVSAGHSAATYAELQAARAAGLGWVTHAGNASDWPHRAPGALGFMASEPGVVGTLLAEPALPCGVIMDGFHFHPALLAPLVRLKGVDHVQLVSDASTVAGCAPGNYVSGGLEVTVHPGGFATSGRGGGWLAGSTITLLDAVQRAVALAGLTLVDAMHMATLGPARLLGLDARKGLIAPGHDADLVVIDGNWAVRAVVSGGKFRHELDEGVQGNMGTSG